MTNITCNTLKYYLHLNVTVVCYKRKTLFDIIVVLFINKNMLVMYILHHNSTSTMLQCSLICNYYVQFQLPFLK